MLLRKSTWFRPLIIVIIDTRRENPSIYKPRLLLLTKSVQKVLKQDQTTALVPQKIAMKRPMHYSIRQSWSRWNQTLLSTGSNRTAAHKSWETKGAELLIFKLKYFNRWQTLTSSSVHTTRSGNGDCTSTRSNLSSMALEILEIIGRTSCVNEFSANKT